MTQRVIKLIQNHVYMHIPYHYNCKEMYCTLTFCAPFCILDTMVKMWPKPHSVNIYKRYKEWLYCF